MRLKRAKKEQLAQIKQLYETAFPKEERKPFFLLQWQMKRKVMEILSIEENGFVGLLISSFYKDLVLIEFLAIDDKRRGEGLGSKVLDLAKKRYQARRVVLEIEIPDENAAISDNKVRRKEFYARNGFLPAGVEVMFHGVPMMLLTIDGKSVTFAEYKKLYQNTSGYLITSLLKISELVREK
ncbi:MAG: GNAT family N-acetyltransferase [Firmicutes bacterium]|uniref:GNAT family N-acetyltransferase n=1 Tax=Candidatus Scybalomonas excrementavium TaxID=2840943 RepID=A0A9D9N7M9_9FIRM|nr:GNAT family N-acetyltransferase [Candidatus Scybalomonas excrementavium]